MRTRQGWEWVLGAALLGTACGGETLSTLTSGLQVTPEVVDFGAVPLGQSVSRTVLIRNTGESNLSLTLSRGANGSPEVSAPETLDALGPGSTRQIELTYTPVSTGGIDFVFTVRSPEVEATFRVRGEAVATPLRLDPTAFDFGLTILGTTADTRVTLENTSDFQARVQLRDDDLVGACPLQPGRVFCYRLRGASAATVLDLQAREQTTIDIDFSPEIADMREQGSLGFTTCETCPPVTLRLSGTGVDQGIACEEVVDFGAFLPDRCTTRAVSCENIANAPVVVTGWSVGGDAAFRAEPGATVPVSPSQTIDIDVEFCPTALTDYSGTLSVETGGGGGRRQTVEVALTGTGGGPRITVTPSAVSFGRVATIAPAVKRFVVANTGFDPLQVTQIVGDENVWSAVPTIFQLSPGDQQVVDVTFAPEEEGVYRGSLTIQSNDQTQPGLRLPVTGVGVALPPCNYQIQPDTLRFGTVAPGNSLRRGVRVQNLGQSECLIYDATVIDDSTGAFSATVAASSIAGGESGLIDVRFAPPRGGELSARLALSLSSTLVPPPVELQGSAASGALLVAPSAVDFGNVGLACTSRQRTITVYNSGVTTVALTSLAVVDGGSGTFALEGAPQLPVTLGGGESTTFDVTFRPTAVGTYAAAVRLQTNEGGPLREYYVSLRGEGSLDAIQTDRFEQLGNPQADILFLVDNSCSMRDEQTSLANNFRAFIEYAEREEIDYHLSIVPLDFAVAGFGEFVGQPAERVITPQTQPDPLTVFQSNVNLGAVGPGPERGFDAAYTALTPPLLTTRHQGFLRRDAVLSLIVVSDQPDLSMRSVDFFQSFFLSVKGFDRPNAMTFSSIVGPEMGNCQGPGGTAQQGPRYREMTRRTGGVAESICTSDWSRALENLSTVAFGFRTEFFLTSTPVPGTIEITLNGVPFPASSGQVPNWSYLAAQNAIGFSPVSAPEPGSVIEVTYEASCN